MSRALSGRIDKVAGWSRHGGDAARPVDGGRGEAVCEGRSLPVVFGGRAVVPRRVRGTPCGLPGGPGRGGSAAAGSRGRDDSAHLRMVRRSSHRSGRKTSRTARTPRGQGAPRRTGAGAWSGDGRGPGPWPARPSWPHGCGTSPPRGCLTGPDRGDGGGGKRCAAVRRPPSLGWWAGGLVGWWAGGSVGRGAPPRGRRARERRVLRRRSPHRCAPGASRWARTAAGSTSRCRRRFTVSRARAARQGPRHRAGPVAKHGRGSGGGARGPSACGSPRPSERGSPRPGGRGELSGRRRGALSPTCSTPPRARRTGCAARRSSSSGGSRPDGTRSG